jgi:glyoxylase-like metal-dependent hydrolase (beta-lactamase superfamily II)
MPAFVKILIEGYTNADSLEETGKERTQPTVTLVKDGGMIMVVDPGVMENQKALIDALEKENLRVKDVNIVCLTHSHIDHYRNAGMFPDAKVLEFFGLWENNICHEWQEQFAPNVKILKTPGHDYTGLTVLVNTKDGIVAVCGDVFWKKDYPQDPQDDVYASDSDKLEESRELVMKNADWIIPGHAGIYKNPKEFYTPKKDPTEDQKEDILKKLGTCRKCRNPLQKIQDRCNCRPWLCYHCCECGLDCDNCSCSHKEE